MKKEEIIYDNEPSENYVQDPYYPIIETENFFSDDLLSKLTKDILNRITNSKLSISKWRKYKSFDLTWSRRDNEKVVTKISFDILKNSLKKVKKYPKDNLNLPPLNLTWLENTTGLGIPHCIPAKNAEINMTFTLGTNLGETFPFNPSIEREGIVLSSFQANIESMLLRSRIDLIQQSHQMFDLGSNWISYLISYLNTAISAIDVILMQLYYKAKYDSVKMGWNFDEQRLGSPVSRRLTDKLTWINTITRNHIEDISSELISLERLKTVRNHLNHFDPPCFACTIEDLSIWINDFNGIVSLIYKIRKSIDAPISERLIELLMQTKVNYVIRDPGKKRYYSQFTGYKTCFETSTGDSEEIRINWK